MKSKKWLEAMRSPEYREKMRQRALERGAKPPAGWGRKWTPEFRERFKKLRTGHPLAKGSEKGWFQKGQKSFFAGKKRPEISGEKHFAWKGDEARNQSIHGWMRRRLGKASYCTFNRTHEGKFEWASISHHAKRDLNDYMSLCIRCHRFYDKNPIAMKGYLGT